MESIATIRLNRAEKKQSNKLLDWLFEKQDTNSFTYEYWYENDVDEENKKNLERLLERHKDFTDWGKIEHFGFQIRP